MKVQVTPAAVADLKRIFRDGVERFGLRQADMYLNQLEGMFNRLGGFPKRYPERSIGTGTCRVCTVGAHIILYTIEAETVLILRVRHGHEDWQGNP